jgi:hypothetical protein
LRKEEVEISRQSPGNIKDNEIILGDTTMIDGCRYICVKPIESTRVNPIAKNGL